MYRDHYVNSDSSPFKNIRTLQLQHRYTCKGYYIQRETERQRHRDTETHRERGTYRNRIRAENSGDFLCPSSRGGSKQARKYIWGGKEGPKSTPLLYSL